MSFMDDVVRGARLGKGIRPPINDVLAAEPDVRGWEYNSGWEVSYIAVLRSELGDEYYKNKEKDWYGKEEEFTVKTFDAIVYILDSALNKDDGESLNVINLFKLNPVRNMFAKFATSPTAQKSLVHLPNHWKDDKDNMAFWAELVNARHVADTGKFSYWINNDQGESTRNSITDHQLLLWKDYELPEAASLSKVHVVINRIQGYDLVAKDKNGYSDPYVVIGQFTGGKWHQITKTSSIHKELHPVWNDKFEFDIDANVPLSFILNDKDLIGHDFMGSVNFDPKILYQVKTKSGKDKISFTQKVTGLNSDKGGVWKPIVSGIVDVEFSVISKL